MESRRKRRKGYVRTCLFLLWWCLGCAANGMERKEEERLVAWEKTEMTGEGEESEDTSEEISLEQELEELKKQLSMEEIDGVLKDSSLKNDVDFSQVVEALLEGNLEEGTGMIWHLVGDYFLEEVRANSKNMVQIVLVAVLSALFSNIAAGFLSSTLQETGFFVVYLTMTGLIFHSFSLMLSITEQTLSEVFAFMEVLIPTYVISITMVSGSAASMALYELTFLMMKGCQWALKTVLVPLIEGYMVVGIINYIGETERFTYLGELMKKGTEQLLKWSLGIVLGINLIQNMILPAVDAVKSNVWQKGLSAIPGAGSVISLVTGSLLGSAVLIKNSIGVGGLLFLVLLCVVPVVKLMILMCSFYLCAAFLQPISDKRLMNLLQTAGEGGKLFLQVVITCFTLFFITIALAAVSTNVRYYAL